MNAKTFYITTPLYYVNDAPHIGHAYTTVAADVLARFYRSRGQSVFFLTGTDEHGQKVAQAAAARHLTPLAHADTEVVRFQALWKRLNISYDDFVRTTEIRHTSIVVQILQALWDRGEIYAADYQGWYCLPDERFWTDKEVINGNCPDCHRPVTPLSERNYFFRMGKYQEDLRHHIAQHPDWIQPATRRNEVMGFLNQPLNDLCISRPKSRLSWGIPLPFDSDYVTYVWWDALVNYVSMAGYGTARFSEIWPADWHLVGKDILTTHAVYWSTMLMALGLPLPLGIFAHGWWTVNEKKMSKSLKNVVDPHTMIEAFGADAFRYFLLREVPFGEDGDFSDAAMIHRINGDLANDLGNLVSRTLGLVEQLADGIVPPPVPAGGHPEALNLIQTVKSVAEGMGRALTRLEFHRALGSLWELVNQTNCYIEQMAPWKLAKNKESKDLLQTMLYTAAETVRIIAFHLRPFLPETASRIERQLGLPTSYDARCGEALSRWGGEELAQTRIMEKSERSALFPRIDSSTLAAAPETVAAVPETPQTVDIKDFAAIDLRVGVILSAERIAKSKKLLKLVVDIALEKRQVVAGIGTHYAPETLIGKKVALVANLKPAMLMGTASEGMLLAAGSGDVLELITFSENMPLGSRIK